MSSHRAADLFGPQEWGAEIDGQGGCAGLQLGHDVVHVVRDRRLLGVSRCGAEQTSGWQHPHGLPGEGPVQSSPHGDAHRRVVGLSLRALRLQEGVDVRHLRPRRRVDASEARRNHVLHRGRHDGDGAEGAGLAICVRLGWIDGSDHNDVLVPCDHILGVVAAIAPRLNDEDSGALRPPRLGLGPPHDVHPRHKQHHAPTRCNREEGRREGHRVILEQPFARLLENPFIFKSRQAGHRQGGRFAWSIFGPDPVGPQ
mmetsp:Transcript_4262/g.11439  ORF Transcript_4262/g.11439 Transcript_4262/m.11439 type:complete len:256 (-) Transcript_4262:5-772(-)